LLASADLPEQSHVQPDESVALNSVVVRQASGEINAGLQAQLRRLEELLS
jgi:flagellar assembly protein FliH